MNVKSLLALAGECKTEKQVLPAFLQFKSAFTSHFEKRLSRLCLANDDYWLEKPGQPFLQFEVNYEISNEFIISAKIEIRTGALVVYVVCNHMLDKLGMYSRSCKPDNENEALLEFEGDSSVQMIIKAMVDEFIRQHTLLLMAVGLNTEEADKAAKRRWKRVATAYTTEKS